MADTFTVYKFATDVPAGCGAVEPCPDGPLPLGAMWMGESTSVCAEPTKYLVVVYPRQTDDMGDWKNREAYVGACERHVVDIRAQMQSRIISIEMYVQPENLVSIPKLLLDLPSFAPPIITFDPGSIVIITGV